MCFVFWTHTCYIFTAREIHSHITWMYTILIYHWFILHWNATLYRIMRYFPCLRERHWKVWKTLTKSDFKVYNWILIEVDILDIDTKVKSTWANGESRNACLRLVSKIALGNVGLFYLGLHPCQFLLYCCQETGNGLFTRHPPCLFPHPTRPLILH